MTPLPSGPFSLLYVDPPWRFKVYGKNGQKKACDVHYPTMTTADVMALPVAEDVWGCSPPGNVQQGNHTRLGSLGQRGREMVVQFTIPGKPVGKARARIVRRNGKVIAYTPAKTATWSEGASWEARAAMLYRPPLQGPLVVDIWAVFEPPRSNRHRNDHIVKPDLDNIIKAVCDSCNGIVWNDDSQIVKIVARKSYGERAAVHVTAKVADHYGRNSTGD